MSKSEQIADLIATDSDVLIFKGEKRKALLSAVYDLTDTLNEEDLERLNPLMDAILAGQNSTGGIFSPFRKD